MRAARKNENTSGIENDMHNIQMMATWKSSLNSAMAFSFWSVNILLDLFLYFSIFCPFRLNKKQTNNNKINRILPWMQ